MLKLFLIRAFIFIFIFFPLATKAQITYFASASVHADNSNTNAANNPAAVTPPANMRDGDLVIFTGVRRISNQTLTISNTGGQNWNSLPVLTGVADISPRIFWCRFNGTWTGDPSIEMGGASINTAVMHVFRPSARTYSWAMDVGQTIGAPTTRTATINAITNTQNTTLVFAAWFTADDNTWDQLTAGWSTPGSSQYRNPIDPDMSCTFAYRIFTVSGSTGNVSKRQATNQTDNSRTAIMSFYPFRTNMSAFLLE
ncbi:hypothetical protein [Sediminibacterium goheungense]|uniref:hypothetical protein n=1 Tax=Sediminibacterium goheungense TaxID=1086393 RepID=UPI00105D198F|nr:hypothetical protein [Sediminibacterium goheungense]